MQSRTRSHRKQRVLDFVLYILIGISVCVAAFLLPVYTTVDSKKMFRWIGLAAITAVTFGYSLKGLPRRLRTRSVWFTWSALLTAHTIVYCTVLLRVKDWPLINFAIINMLEIPIVSMVLFRVVLLGRRTPKSASQRLPPLDRSSP